MNYQVLASTEELKWFYDHVVMKPQINESYSMVFVCRHKKLTKEEQESIGLTRKEAEFLSTQSIRLGKVKDAFQEPEWTFDRFQKAVKRFQVDKYAYTTALGEPLPERTLAVLFYVNPCDDIKVADYVFDKINAAKMAITKALLNGKTMIDVLQTYQTFGNLESSVKHAKANCKGSVYWLDYDIDIPSWFKGALGVRSEYEEQLLDLLADTYGKGNYVVVSTSGGYHVLVRTSAIKQNPRLFSNKVYDLYQAGIKDGNEPYLDEKGNSKFECIVNDSQIPGLPLPGTYQYGRPVTVLNKEDFE